jgi:hypothetical protein
MAAPATKPLTSPATEPATPLERALHDRKRVTDALADLNRAAAKLRETGAAEASVLAEIDALAAADVLSMKEWASGGCLGEAPRSDQQKRIVLGQKLNAAQAAAAAAKGAGADIDQQIVQLSDRLRSIGDEIERAVFDLVGSEHSEVIAEYTKVCERAGQLAAKISGLAMYYRDAGHLQQAAVIAATKLANPGTNRLEIMAEADAWGRRITALRRGPAS